MAVVNDPNTAANIAQVAPTTTAVNTFALRTLTSHLPHGSLGHYRSAVRFSMANTQGANSRLWEVRNSSTNLIIPTRLKVTILELNTNTAVLRKEIDLFRLTGFSVLDTTGTVTPTASLKRTGMAASPGNAQIRHVTIAGAAGGMTGGTLTKDGGAVSMMEWFAQTAIPTTPTLFPQMWELLDDVNGTHPFVLAQNEGLLLENIVVHGAASGGSVTVDFSWAEVTAF